jgi:hypothetical protein
MCTNPALKAAPILCRLIRKNTENILPRLWSEKVQDDPLEALRNIVNTFVDLAWGADSAEWTPDMPPKAYYEFMP